MNTDNLALRPNCLLTKHPLVFIAGTRSLFFYEKLGGFLQDFIAAHGYTVLAPAMPFRSKQLRKTYLNYWFKQQKTEKFHFILSKNTYGEFQELFKNYQSSTFTIISRDLGKDQFKESVNNQSPPFTYLLHKLFCMALGTKVDPYNETLQDISTEFYDRFLDRCVELAENEII